jgi:hypothetical protein
MRLTDATLLRAAAHRAARRPAFLGYDLAGYREVIGEDPAAWLDVDAEQLDRLALCRTPRRGLHFAHDILTISTHVGVDSLALVGLIRRVEVLAELQWATQRLDEEPEPDRAPAVLAAARDDIDEYTALSDTRAPASGLPGWVHDAVNRLWAVAPVSMQFPRDLDFAVLIGLPLALVELPRLSLHAISEWLTDHKVDLNVADQGDRRLRACLIALGGVGLIFVDAEDDPTQRRISLGHEAAHFIVEYLLPRQEVARRRPELLELVDGQRPPTAKERLSAVLGDVPIGLHTHLLDHGDGHGGDRRVDEAEWRARRVALELLAPQSVVLERVFQAGQAEPDEVRRLLVEEFGLPVSLAADYAEQLVTLAGPPRLGLLDVLGTTQKGSSSREPETRAEDARDRKSDVDPEDE